MNDDTPRTVAAAYIPHTMYPGGPECPCPAPQSPYHRWFNDGRTHGQQDADRLASGIKAALVIRLIAGETDQTYTPTEVSTMVSEIVDQQMARLVPGAES